MSYVHVQRLAPVADEHNAARVAVGYVERVWHLVASEPEMHGLTRPHIRMGARGLESAYIVRLFSEFEVILQDHLAANHPGRPIPRTAEALVNRVALRERIPDAIRDAVHGVREYRNAIVHRRTAAAVPLDFREAAAALNRYLARLP